jgi:hypothetical protein
VTLLAMFAGASLVMIEHRNTARWVGPPVPPLGERAGEIAALERYANRESFLPPGDAVIAIRQEFLQSVIDQSLPFRRYFDRQRYVARLDRAIVRLERGVAQVTLFGSGSLTGHEDSPLRADLRVRGLVVIDGIDPDRGVLRARVVFRDVASRPSRPHDVVSELSPVFRYFGGLRADDWNRREEPLVIPVAIEHDIVLPALDGQVTISETRVPVSFAVTEVTTFEGRMAISLGLLPDSLANAGPPPRADTVDVGGRERSPGGGPDVGAGTWRDTNELTLRVLRLAGRDSLWRSVLASDHDVVVIAPAPLLDTLVSRASRRYLHGVDIDIHAKRRIPFDVSLKVKVLGNQMKVGKLEGSVHLDRIAGRLTLAGDPRVTLVPPSDIIVAMPARVVAGRGAIAMDVAWDPALITSMVCRGFEFHEHLEGEILPFESLLTTQIHYSIRDSFMVGQPRVRRDAIRIGTDLSDSSWSSIRDVLVAQDRLSRCGLVMDADSVLGKLRRLAGRGVKIHLPPRMFKPFRLPVMIEERYTSGGYRVEARMFDPDVRVKSDHLRLAFRARLRVIAAADRDAPVSLLGPGSDHTDRTRPGPLAHP